MKVFGIYSAIVGDKIFTNKELLKDWFVDVHNENNTKQQEMILSAVQSLLDAVSEAFPWGGQEKGISAKKKREYTTPKGDVKAAFWGLYTPWNDGGYLLLALAKLHGEVVTNRSSRRRFIQFLEESRGVGGSGPVGKAIKSARGGDRNGDSTSVRIYSALKKSWSKWNER